MRDTLLSSGPRKNDSFILNLQTNKEPGSRQVAVKKRADTVVYFDSYRTLISTVELQCYLKDCIMISIKNIVLIIVDAIFKKKKRFKQ